MGIPIQKVLAEFPKNRQEKIKTKANEYIREYKKLADLRKDLGFTQETIARHQGIKQVNISNLEKRNDMLISTLKKYVESIGCKLEINIRLSNSELASVKELNPARKAAARK
jgi:transcriptional regulator with XRE-family HTH domain